MRPSTSVFLTSVNSPIALREHQPQLHRIYIDQLTPFPVVLSTLMASLHTPHGEGTGGHVNKGGKTFVYVSM